MVLQANWAMLWTDQLSAENGTLFKDLSAIVQPGLSFLCPPWSPSVVPYAPAFKKSVQSILRSEVWGRGRASGHMEKKTVNLQLLYIQSGIHLKTWPLQHPGCNGKIERLFVDQCVTNTYKSVLMERGQGRSLHWPGCLKTQHPVERCFLIRRQLIRTQEAREFTFFTFGNFNSSWLPKSMARELKGRRKWPLFSSQLPQV